MPRIIGPQISPKDPVTLRLRLKYLVFGEDGGDPVGFQFEADPAVYWQSPEAVDACAKAAITDALTSEKAA